MPRRYSLRANALFCGTLAVASAFLLLTSGAGYAAGSAPTAAKAPKASKVEARAASGSVKKAAPEVTGDPLDRSAFAKATPEDTGACFTGRKKLWVEGEGWIVRRVTTCQ